MDFDVSKDIVSEKIIGEIWYQNEVNVKELLANGKTEIFELNQGVWDILVIDKNRVLFSDPFSNCLTLYDQNFNLLRKIDTINGESFNPYGLACSDNHLYLVDQYNHRILMTDFEFSKIKSVGSIGNLNNEFDTPYGICLIDEILYICDYYNQRIQVYSKDLEFIKSAKVDYGPWVIKAFNSLLFVQPAILNFIFIYELCRLNLKLKIDNPAVYVFCRLSVLNSKIYRFNSESKSVSVFDGNGKFKEEMIVNNVDVNIISGSDDGTFIAFNGNLLMKSYGAKKLIKFSRK